MKAAVLALLTIQSAVLVADEWPQLPEGFRVSVFAREPLVRNPCAMAFDAQGRLFVSQGPQYRHPKPETPGDRITILIDSDNDGVADRAKTFAEGFNHIQGLAWRGRDLWVANAPELTVVRDLDGDDVADQYVLIYGGLGNLEHALHGLNWAPDGMLYMSKGNSKGYLDESSRELYIAPKAFADLWGMNLPKDAQEIPAPIVFDKGQYKKGYHHPSDDWGTEGGILRCDPQGKNLEIVSRGTRNPWDIAFGENFDWLGTDQDQDGGDRIIRPFYAAHFGWGHSWSPHWTGENHLPTVPVSGRVFHGSGTGVVYCVSSQFPKRYRGVFFINDWLRRMIFVFRPKWDGAMMRNMAEPEVFAAAPNGRSLGSSSGIVFDPTDIEVGPDGALWVLSWGHGYGARFENGHQTNEGRVYRIAYGDHKVDKPDAKRSNPYDNWSAPELLDDLQHDRLPVWRTDAQVELVRRGAEARDELTAALSSDDLPAGASTWIAWTLGQIDTSDRSIDKVFAERAATGSLVDRIQAIRVLAQRARRSDRPLPEVVSTSLTDRQPRIRFAAAQAIHESRRVQHRTQLWNAAATETDRAVFYAVWRALGELASEDELCEKLSDSRAGVRRAALLALLEVGALSGDEVVKLRLDQDRDVAELAVSFLEKVGTSAEPVLKIQPSESTFHGTLEVRLVSGQIPGAHPRYTLDGSEPSDTSGRKYNGPIRIDRDTVVRAAMFRGRVRIGPVLRRAFNRVGTAADAPTTVAADAIPVFDLKANSGHLYRAGTLRVGQRVYTNRRYVWTKVPDQLIGQTAVQTANEDDDVGSQGDQFLRFKLIEDSIVYIAHDRRIQQQPNWLGEFEKSQLTMTSEDTTFDLLKKRFSPGSVVLGGNTTDGNPSGRSQYVMVVTQAPLLPRGKPTTIGQALAALNTSISSRGSRLFFGAASCSNCHRLGERGNAYAPDLSNLGSRADAKSIAQSILEPNAVITEGFHSLSVATTAGKVYTGFIRQESGLALELIQADGSPVSIPKANIEQRRRTNVSAMPKEMANSLSPQQVADLIAWISGSQERRAVDGNARQSKEPAGSRKTERPTKPASKERKSKFRDSEAPEADTSGSPILKPKDVRTVGDKKRGFYIANPGTTLNIGFDGRQVASYVYRHDQVKRPFFANVKAPGGVQVTRNFPPVQGKNSTDHGTMHPGFWLAFGDLDGTDFWRNKGTVVHEGFEQSPKAETDKLSFSVRNQYQRPDGSTVCHETCKYTLLVRKAGFLLLWDSTFSSPREFYFGDQEEMGLGIRVATPIRVVAGGTILDAEKRRNGKQVWGKASSWCDYSGIVNAQRVGITIFCHPDNFRRSWMHARDYGALVANPFGRKAFGKGATSRVTVKKGERFRLRYALLLHANPKDKRPNLQAAYVDYLQLVDREKKKRGEIDAALRSVGRHPKADEALAFEKKGEYSAALKILEELPDSAFSEPMRWEIRSIDEQGRIDYERIPARPNIHERRLAIIRCRRALGKPADVTAKIAWELIAEQCTDPMIRLCITEHAVEAGTLGQAANRLRALFKKHDDEMASGMALTYIEAVRQINAGQFAKPLSIIRNGAYRRNSETSYVRDLKEQICQALARRNMTVVPHLIRELDPNGQPTWIVYCLGLCRDRRAVAPLLEYAKQENNTWVQSEIRAALKRIRQRVEQQ